ARLSLQQGTAGQRDPPILCPRRIQQSQRGLTLVVNKTGRPTGRPVSISSHEKSCEAGSFLAQGQMRSQRSNTGLNKSRNCKLVSSKTNKNICGQRQMFWLSGWRHFRQSATRLLQRKEGRPNAATMHLQRACLDGGTHARA